MSTLDGLFKALAVVALSSLSAASENVSTANAGFPAAAPSATTMPTLEVAATNTLTLNSAHSFDITLSATDQRTGHSGEGQAIPQNDIFGYFSIPTLTGNAANPEVFVKILDASGIGQGYWVFYGGLTDLEYTLSVQENSTGTIKRYHKSPGSSGGGFDTSGFDTPQGDPAETAPCSPASPALSSGEAPSGSEHTLTLNSAHAFDIILDATDQRTGHSGEGQAIPQNDIFGYFSIPTLTGNAANPEVFVKILDASGIGQGYWVFFGGLTDLDYTLSVRENATGHVKSYHKAGGSACGGFDTSGFDLIATPTPTPTPSSGSPVIVNVAQSGAMTFSPSTAVIHAGDTVQWNFKDDTGYHSTTSGTCTFDPYGYGGGGCTPLPGSVNWDSGQRLGGDQFSWLFSTAGSYRYYCSVHGDMMTGTIRVNP